MASSSSRSTITSSSFDEYNLQLQGSVLKTTKLAVGLPSDLSFHRSVDSDFADDLDACSDQILALTNVLLDLASTSESSKASTSKGKQRLDTQDDVVDHFHSFIVDAMDHLLERADMCLDKHTGRVKPPAIAINPPQKKKAPRGPLDPALQHASHLLKPQLRFKTPVANRTADPWRPRLKHKYNAQVPLGYVLRNEGEEGSGDSLLSLHPYLYEIKHISYPARMYIPCEPTAPKSFEQTPFTWVTSQADLSIMLDKLRAAKEIAVDLEHHSYRSFAGFVCLMQISTREEDFVVDTLVLREELEELNEVFTDPKIVKIFHGAQSDIVWLEHNFNIYVVNLFDTYHASKVLDFPKHGLASLLEMYCDFTADKRYQLADWRIRPLPQEMLFYARSDTHYLLYIYDNLRNALLDRGESQAQSSGQTSPGAPPVSQSFMGEVLKRSEETCLSLYQSEIYDAEGGSGPGGWDALARKWNKVELMMDSVGGGRVEGMKRAVYRYVHAWRDRVAREEDENTRYVLPNHYLFRLAEKPPADMAALLANFDHTVPPVVRTRASELLDGIRNAVKTTLGGAQQSDMIPIPESVSITAPESEPNDVEASTKDADESLASRLWSRVPGQSSVKAAFSSLFVSDVSSLHKARPRYSASGSSLFVKQVPAEEASRSTSDAEQSQFTEIVSRINRSLNILPSSRPDMHEGVNQDEPMSTQDHDIQEPSSSGQPIELPFVPPSQRQSTNMDTVDDSIVVVGQARQKKRKRSEKTKKGKGGELDEAGDDVSPPQDIEPFDYSTASNILDDVPDTVREPVGKRKKRQPKTGVIEYGNFPAPPRAHREVKKGNQSLTFK